MIRALTRGQAWGIADMPISATRDVRDTLAAVAELDDIRTCDSGCSIRTEPCPQGLNRALVRDNPDVKLRRTARA